MKNNNNTYNKLKIQLINQIIAIINNKNITDVSILINGLIIKKLNNKGFIVNNETFPYEKLNLSQLCQIVDNIA